MPAFLKDISKFYGAVERNAAGQTLEDFLEEYDPYVYKNPCVTVDTVVAKIQPEQRDISGTEVLMIKRGNHPSIGKWALPGGFIDLHEDTMEAAKRELQEETGIEGLPVEQLRAWGEYDRDPRARIVTVAYLGVIEQELPAKAGDDAADADYFTVDLKKKELETKENRVKCLYEMILSGQNGVVNRGVVEYTENATGILRQPEYRIVESDGIASDHAAVILQAMLYLQERLTDRK